MRVVLIARRLGISGGGEYSLYNLKALLERRHEVLLIGSHLGGTPFADAISFDTSWRDVAPGPFQPLLETGYFGIRAFRYVTEFDPDMIMSQHQHSLFGAELAKYIDCPHILRLHEFSLLHEADGLVGKSFHKAVVRTCQHSDLIIANSQYTADRYADLYDTEIDVVHPFILKDTVTTDTTGEKILHIRPVERKGIDITLSVAEQCPEREFLIAGTDPDSDMVRERMEDLPNVEYAGYIDDIRTVYADSRAVLMPSTWAEPYGMIAVEAGINGLPVFCSGRGGLGEAVGDSRFIVESNLPEDYISKLNTLDSSYEKFSRAALENAESRTAERQYERFSAIASTKVGLAL
jgi:glycosyltransferase involved in cell wall biosynthesis